MSGNEKKKNKIKHSYRNKYKKNNKHIVSFRFNQNKLKSDFKTYDRYKTFGNDPLLRTYKQTQNTYSNSVLNKNRNDFPRTIY